MELNEVTIVIDEIMRAIENLDNEKLERYLKLVNLGAKNSDQLLASFLTSAEEWNREDAVRIIINRWKSETNLIQIDYLTTLLWNRDIDIDTLKFVTKVYDRTLEDYLYGLIAWDSNPDTHFAAYRMLEIFPGGVGGVGGVSDIAFWQQALEACKDQWQEEIMGNQVMTEFCAARVEEYSKFKETPDYVKDFGIRITNTGEIIEDSRVDLGYDKDFNNIFLADPIFQLPNSENATLLLMEGTIGDNREDSLSDDLLHKYAMADRQEKVAMIKPVMLRKYRLGLANDPTLYRIFGPPNVIWGSELSSNHFCTRFGGCRMLTCIEFDRYDDEDQIGDAEDVDNFNDTDYDWFTGFCQTCHVKIASRCYAVRRPLTSGGWMGCFCSWEHVSSNDSLTTRMIANLKREMAEIGIQERRY